MLVLLFLCPIWWLNLVVEDRQQDPPSLPFAHPRAKAKTLVVDQELLQCWLYFKSTMSITKYSSLIWINWHFIHPFYLNPYGALLLFQILGGCKVEQFYRTASHSSFDQLSFWRIRNFVQIKVSSSNNSLNRSMCMIHTKGFWCCLSFSSYI